MRNTILAWAVVMLVSLPAISQDAGKSRPKVQLTRAPIETREQLFKKTPQGELKLHLFFPPQWKETDKRPAIVFFFGGGWKSGSYSQFVPQAEYLASRGIVAACADYRIASIHKTTPDKCLEDAKSAVRWLRSKSAGLGIDPEKLIGAGGSAGGHLAAATALVPGFESPEDDVTISCKPNALVLYNPALNLTGRIVPAANGEDISDAFSPTKFLAANAPPTLIFFGTSDAMIGQGKEFLQLSLKLGNRVELYSAANMPHGFFNRSPWIEVTTVATDQFLTSLGYLEGSPTLALPKDSPSLNKE